MVRSAGVLGLSVAASSALGYPLLLLAAGHLNAADNAVFLGFWGLLMGVGSSLSPLEQELSRQAAEAAGNKLTNSAWRSFVVTQSFAAVIGAAVLIPAVSDRFFSQHYPLAVIILCGVIAFPALYGIRGLLIGRGQAARYSAVLLTEAGLRFTFFVLLVAAGIAGLPWLAAAAAAGSFAWLFFVPWAKGAIDFRSSQETWGAIGRRMLGLTASAVLIASVLTGYPAVVKLITPPGDEDLLSGVLLGISLLRSPLLLLVSPVQALAIPAVVRMSAHPDSPRRLRRTVMFGGVATALFGLVAATGAYLAGPWVFELLYRDKYDVPAWSMAGLGWSGVMLAATLVAAAVLVARRRTSQVVAVWTTVAAASVVLLLGFPGDMLVRTMVGATFAPTLGLMAAIVLLLARDTRKPPA